MIDNTEHLHILKLSNKKILNVLNSRKEVCKVMDICELVRLNNFMMCIWIIISILN